MSIKVPLPDGFSATLRDPKELKERHRRLIQTSIVPLQSVFQKIPRDLLEKAAKGDEESRILAQGYMATAVTTYEEANASLHLQDAVIIALLERWDRPEPLPTIENVTDLEPALYAALLVGTESSSAALMEAALPTDFEPKPEGIPSPFGRSGSSGRRSKAGANGDRSRKPRRTTGESTATAP